MLLVLEIVLGAVDFVSLRSRSSANCNSMSSLGNSRRVFRAVLVASVSCYRYVSFTTTPTSAPISLLILPQSLIFPLLSNIPPPPAYGLLGSTLCAFSLRSLFLRSRLFFKTTRLMMRQDMLTVARTHSTTTMMKPRSSFSVCQRALILDKDRGVFCDMSSGVSWDVRSRL